MKQTSEVKIWVQWMFAMHLIPLWARISAIRIPECILHERNLHSQLHSRKYVRVSLALFAGVWFLLFHKLKASLFPFWFSTSDKHSTYSYFHYSHYGMRRHKSNTLTHIPRISKLLNCVKGWTRGSPESRRASIVIIILLSFSTNGSHKSEMLILCVHHMKWNEKLV